MNRFEKLIDDLNDVQEHVMIIKGHEAWNTVLDALKMAAQQEKTIQAVKKASVPRLGIWPDKSPNHDLKYEYKSVAPDEKVE